MRYLALCWILLLCAQPVGAAEQPTSQTFTVGVEDYENFMPYSEYSNGRYGGLGRAILDAFAVHKGYRFDYRVYPLKRRDWLFMQGKLDFSFPDNPNWVAELRAGLDIAYAPMLDFIDGVLVLPEHKGKGLERLKVLGIPLGFTPYPYASSIESGAVRVEESADYDSLYLKLIKRRVDGVYVNIRIAKYYWAHIQKSEKVLFTFDPGLPYASGQWYLSSIRHPAVIEEFEAFMRDNPQLIDRLKRQYGF